LSWHQWPTGSSICGSCRRMCSGRMHCVKRVPSVRNTFHAPPKARFSHEVGVGE
jgi:hypothetical protein